MKMKEFTAPDDWSRIETIDMHTGGEPLRVVVHGGPEIEGDSVLARRAFVRDHADEFRRALMWEPRGHADMYGCYIVPPDDEGAAFGVIFMHNEGYSTMCGHATIALGKLAVEAGWVEPVEPVTRLAIDAPCGRLQVAVTVAGGRAQAVSFECVPSFVAGLDLEVAVPDLGAVRYDLAYGGAFYAYVDAAPLGLALVPDNYAEIIRQGMAIKRAVMGSGQAIEHPFEPDLSFLYGTIFIGGPVSAGVDSRNVCVFAEGEVDRCPTGSGVSGRMAIHYARGELGVGEGMRVESIIGSVFWGEVVRAVEYGGWGGVVPRVEGRAFFTGRHEFWVEEGDEVGGGFFLR